MPSLQSSEIELTTWGVVYTLLGWSALLASLWGGPAEAGIFLGAGVVLVPLGLGLLFRWPLARWAALVIFAGVMIWSVWQLIIGRGWLLPVALMLTSAETLWCVAHWRKRIEPDFDDRPSESK